MSSQPQTASYTKSIAVSWMEIHQDSRKLAEALKATGQTWDKVVAVTRGGLIPAAIVARELGIYYIDTICARSYEDTTDKTEVEVAALEIIKSIQAPSDGGKSILVIDDLVDFGTTAQSIKKILPESHLGVVYAKPTGKPYADTYIRDVPQDAWIYFPWELQPNQVKKD